MFGSLGFEELTTVFGVYPGTKLDNRNSNFKSIRNQKGTGMSMVLSKWIITPIKVGCKFPK